MMEPIQISFTPTKDDYVRTLRAFQLRTLQTRFLLGSMGFLILMFMCVALSTLRMATSDPEIYTPPVLLYYPFLCIAVVAFYPAHLFVFQPLILSRQVMKNEQLHSEVQWKMSDDQLLITGKHIESKMDWENFLGAIETREHYLITYKINQRMFQFIPKRAFESAQHEAAFRAMVEAQLGTIKK